MQTYDLGLEHQARVTAPGTVVINQALVSIGLPVGFLCAGLGP